MGKLLFNFAQMAVFRHSVGMKTLIALAEQQRNGRLAPCPLTPLPEQTTTSSGSSMPALNKGMRGKRMLVG